MDCSQIETWIVDFPEQEASVRARVQSHCAHCSPCRELLEASIELDAQMSAAVKAPQKLERKILARLEGRPSYLPELFDFVGWAAMITVAVGLVREFLATYSN